MPKLLKSITPMLCAVLALAPLRIVQADWHHKTSNPAPVDFQMRIGTFDEMRVHQAASNKIYFAPELVCGRLERPKKIPASDLRKEELRLQQEIEKRAQRYITEREVRNDDYLKRAAQLVRTKRHLDLVLAKASVFSGCHEAVDVTADMLEELKQLPDYNYLQDDL